MTKPTRLLLTPAIAFWWRDVIRFLRQRNRIIGALATPLVFWLLVGSGFGPSFRNPSAAADAGSYLAYFFPGTLVLIMLFTAIFSTISVIEDRREGFLQGALVAPLSPAAIPLGKFLGGTTLAVLQAGLFCVLAPLAGIPIGLHQVLLLIPALILVGLAMTGLGFLVAWPMDSTQGFHAIMNIFLMPLWMMSGALFPMPAGTGWLYWLGVLNPVSYGVTAIRAAFSAGSGTFIPAGYLAGLGVTALFAALMFAISVRLVARRSREALI
ncbi:MAG: ABC transporter permease [Chthoniobacterales bacterium]